MRLPFATLSSAAVLACAGVASADFSGFSVERITLGNGHIIMNVYANFSNTTDRVLNVYRSDIFTTNGSGFFQGANAFWQAGNTQNKNTSDDSWVNIGVNPNGTGNAGGSGGTTVGDPNFVNFTDANDSTDFSFIESTGNGAGWYNGNAGNTYGYANVTGDTGRVLLAHFVAADLTEGDLNSYVHWYARLTVKINGGDSEEIDVAAQDFLWIIPAPGALALLGVAGLASRRRRA